jgi:integrase
MAEQEFNREIKNLLEKNEICTHFVVKDKVIQNSTVNKEAPKFKFVSSSTARKTFISLLVKANVPLSYIMACTGHTQIKTVQHYLRVYAEESFTFTESLI